MKSDEKLWAILSYIFILWFVPLWLIKPRLKFAVYHAKQAFGLFLTCIVAWIVLTILAFIPVIGWLISIIVWLLLFVCWLIGLIYAATEKEQPIPVVGEMYLGWFKSI